MISDRRTPRMKIASQNADRALLLVIDVQRDFCPGGRLAIAEGDAVVPAINQLAGSFQHVVLTQDWHPANHTSFASQHPGKQPFDQIELGYGPQTLWPDHCVQNSPGAEFHPGLSPELLARTELILRLVLCLPRKRQADHHRPGRLPAGTRLSAHFHCRPGV